MLSNIKLSKSRNWICVLFLLTLGTVSLGDTVLGQGGVSLDIDQRLHFPIPAPNLIPLIHDGEASIQELVTEGEDNWFHQAQLEGEPFGIGEKIFNFIAGEPGTTTHFVVAEELAKLAGLIYVQGEDLPKGLVRVHDGLGLVTQNCAACHSGMVNNHFIPGIANKWYDQKSVINETQMMMELAIPLLKLEGSKELLEQTKTQLEKLKRYKSLYGVGCEDLAPGMITAARIWEISSKLLNDPKQLETDEGKKHFLCGSTKPPALNTLRFRNIYFWDGSVNTQWVSHWPMFDFFGFDNYQRWADKIKTRAIQSIDAFLTFGTKSPGWEEIMGTQINSKWAAQGFKLFHRSNSCSECHGTYSESGMLKAFRPNVTSIDVVRTDSERTYAAFDELMARFAQYGWAYVPRIDGLQKDYPFGYQAYPLCSTFLNYPYLHTAAVANLDQLLLPEEKRNTSYWLSETIDKSRGGFYTTIPHHIDLLRWQGISKIRTFRKELSNGHSGAQFGTTLNSNDRSALVEYIKTLRCPDNI